MALAQFTKSKYAGQFTEMELPDYDPVDVRVKEHQEHYRYIQAQRHEGNRDHDSEGIPENWRDPSGSLIANW